MPHNIYVLPETEHVYTLDHSTGYETLVLVASDSPITNLNPLGRSITRHLLMESSGPISIAGNDLIWKIILHEKG